MKSIGLYALMFLVMASVLQISTGCSNAQDKIANVSPAEVKKMIDSKEKLTIIDVRTPEEFAEGHIAGAVPQYSIEDITKYKYEGKVILYCRSGKRSAAAWNNFNEKGIKNIYNMTGGIIEWSNSGNKVETGPFKPAASGK